MKKTLLTFAALAMTAGLSFGQQRLVLYEEFTGENCAPCAATNPHLDSVMAGIAPNDATNPSKILMIKYMSPIPSAGQFYYQDQAVTDARINYYSVPFAPYARMDGAVPDPAAASPGHPAYLTQTDINTEAAITSPFNITFSTPTWNATYDSASVDVTITCVSNYAPAQGSIKLRTALVESVDWDTPPGNNGETDFPHAVRAMYPDAGGQSVANSWTAAQTQTITIKGKVPAYVDRQGAPFFVCWIQNDHDLSIAQAGKSAPLTALPVDVSSKTLAVPTTTLCTAGTASTTGTVTIKNTGSTTLTSATIYYKVDNAAWSTQAWTGSLAANATAVVNLPSMSLTAGVHVITDSVAMPNATADLNTVNNNSTKTITVISTAGTALPIAENFEHNGNLPANWELYDANNDGNNWVVAWSGNAANPIGHGGSTWLLWYPNYYYQAGETNYAIIPTPAISGPVALDFWTAHAQYTGQTDKLEVAYSTNCGQTWTSVWTMSDPQLAYGLNSSDPQNGWVVSADSQWHHQSANLSSVPANAIVAFKGVSGFGNNLFIDDINVRSGFPLDVNTAKTATTNDIFVFPNPARDAATLQFNLSNASDVQVNIVDITGRVVANVVNTHLGFGQQQVQIPTANLAEGVYNLTIRTDGGVSTQRLTVVK